MLLRELIERAGVTALLKKARAKSRSNGQQTLIRFSEKLPTITESGKDRQRTRIGAKSMIGHIAGLDQLLFHLVNGVWVSPVLDRLMPVLSVGGNLGAIWLALLGALAALGGKTGRKMALAGLVGLAIGFAASELVKELTVRSRPFLSLADARLLVSPPQSYAFPSGHSTSAFAAASGIAIAAKRLLERVPLWGWAMLALAAAISYSRIYVGVHYPADVMAGLLLGVVCGWIGAWWATRRGKHERPGHSEKTQDAHEEGPQLQYQLKERIARKR